MCIGEIKLKKMLLKLSRLVHIFDAILRLKRKLVGLEQNKTKTRK